jgi:lipopolysaccharide export system protein LptA
VIVTMSFPSSLSRRILLTACTTLIAIGLVDLGWGAAPAHAQGNVSNAPNAMQGFSQNRDQPIQIDAASLEVRDKKKEAVFSGNVKVTQGDTTMSSKTLVVFYDQSESPPPQQQPKKGAKAAPGAPMQQSQPGPTGSSSIKRLEARGNVVVTQKDQVVTGDLAIFDTKANLMTMTGGVVLTQCRNVMKGDRLLVDMTSGTSRVESDGGKVQLLFLPGQGCGEQAPGAPPPPAPGIGSLMPGKQK